MIRLVSVAEMVAVEKEANASGFTYEMMMENAGRGLAEQVEDLYSSEKGFGVLGLVGSGNNGGDTLVALAYLGRWGWRTCAAILRPRTGDDQLVARVAAQGGRIVDVSRETNLEILLDLLDEPGVVLDGVLGTGTRLPLKPDLGKILDAVRTYLDKMEDSPYVVAVDCPSGVDCDSGEAAHECLPADLTVTMAAIKQGLFKFPAYNLVGDLRLVGIGLPEEGEALAAFRAVRTCVPGEDDVASLLPERPLDAHKGTFGTALIVAGSLNYTGAVLLAGEAAYRIGAGLVTLGLPAPLHQALAGRLPEATWLPLPELEGVIAPQAVPWVLGNLSRASALLVGPGFGLGSPVMEFMERLFPAQKQELPPLVVDADGLKLLARLPDWPARLGPPAILTPHPGEMSVLTGLSREEIQSDRLAVARRFSREWGHVVILKGAFTVIAEPGGEAAVIPVASPALARAGSGDVLAGMAVGLLAQGLSAYSAALAAAWIHAHAGLRAAVTVGNPASVLAGDLLEGMVSILNDLMM